LGTPHSAVTDLSRSGSRRPSRSSTRAPLLVQRRLQVVVSLQVQPEPRRHLESPLEPNRGIGSHRTLAQHQFVEAVAADAQFVGDVAPSLAPLRACRSFPGGISHIPAFSTAGTH
jgi:hypothetical protein